MEWRLFDPERPPEWLMPAWYATRDRAPHLEEPEQRGRLCVAAEMIAKAVGECDIVTVCDLGAGDGGLLSLIRDLPCRSWGYDLQQTNIAGAEERGVDVRYADVLHDPIDDGDLAVCTEVLEHLADPHAFLRSLTSRFLLASSPAFENDRLAYQYHTWAFDKDGFAALIEQAGYRIVSHLIDGTTQIVLGVRP